MGFNLVAVVTQTDPDVVWIERPHRRGGVALPHRVTTASKARLMNLLLQIYPWQYVINYHLTPRGGDFKEYRVYQRPPAKAGSL